MNQNQNDLIPTTITNPTAKSSRYYSGDSLAARLESYMLAQNIAEIGDNTRNQIREKYAIIKADGSWDERPSDMELYKLNRIYRTKDISQLTEEGLLLLHDFEQKHMTRFLIGPSEIRKVLKISHLQLPDQVFMSEAELEKWEKITLDSHPQMESFHGFLVPPYFIYDNFFDGMNYHHTIDQNAWKKLNTSAP